MSSSNKPDSQGSDPLETDPFENTIFETLPTAGLEPTLRHGDADDDLGATMPVDAGAEPTLRVTGDQLGQALPTGAGRETADMPPSTPRVTDTLAPDSAPGSERVVPLERNRRIGNYRLDSWVGKGGQGEVWLGENVLAERKVALKFLHAKLAGDAQAMSDLTGEAAVLFDLTHDRIVRLMNIEEASGHAFLVMEFLGGPSLQDVLKRRREGDKRGLSVAEALWILNEIAPGLDYANDEGVTHRDIKPANMMLTEPVDDGVQLDECDARVKLCDFGIAFTANKSMAQKGEYNPIGTLPFMAPEVLLRQQPTRAADIYALGATLYYLVKGKPPIFGKMPARELIERIKSDEPEPLQSGDATFDAAIAKALSKDPEQRQTTADQLLSEASGGKLGRAAQKASLRVAVMSALSVAIVAAGVIWWVLANRTDQVQDLNVDPGQLVGEPTLFVRGSISDQDVEQVVIGFEGGESRLVGRSGEYFEAHVPTPSGDGDATIEFRSTDGERSYGSVPVVIDKTLEVDGVVGRVGDYQPVAIDAGVALRFDFNEPVELEQRFASGYRKLEVDASGVARVGLEDARDVPELWKDTAWNLDFRATDRAGNQREFSFDVDVYDEGAVFENLAASFPVPEGPWSAWRSGNLLEQLDAWTIAARDKRLSPQSQQELLERGGRGRIAQSLRDFENSLGRVELTLFDNDAQATDTGYVIYTSQRSYALRGRVENSRGPTIVGIEDEPTELSDDSTNEFDVPLDLEPGGELVLRLSASQMDDVVVVRIVQDDVPPTIAKLDVPAQVSGDVTLVSANVDDEHISEVWIETQLTDERFELTHLEGSNAWRYDELPLPQEGTNAFILRAVDLAGVETAQLFDVERDTIGPRLDGEPQVAALVAGQAFEASFPFDEEVDEEVVGALEILGADGSVVRAVPATFTVDSGTVRLSSTLPDEEGRVRIRFGARDRLNNASDEFVYDYALEYDPWGSFPAQLRAGAERVEVPEWAGDDWTVYVQDGDQRFPRCVRHIKTGIDFVYAKAGTCELGGVQSIDESARIPSRVRLTGFYIARTEVSKEHFARGNGGDAPQSDPRLPMRVFDHSEALGWCQSLGFELPSEAQWEYAASGPKDFAFPWGGGYDPARVHTSELTKGFPYAPVDSLPGGSSWCHALHMAGNVQELCSDVLDFTTLASGSLDPLGDPANDFRYVLRGGGRTSRHADIVRTDSRVVKQSDESGMIAKLGFRPVWLVAGP